MIKNYLKTAWRNAWTNRSFTLISLSSLILGFTLFFFIALWVKNEISYDKGFPLSKNIFRIESKLEMQDGSLNQLQTVGWPVGTVLSDHYPEIESLTYMRSWNPILRFRDAYFHEDGLFADSNFFSVFGYTLLEGDPATALRDPYSIVISSKLKEKYFGRQDALGKTLILDDTILFNVTGIINELPTPTHLQFDMLGSFSTFCSMYPDRCAYEFKDGWFDVNVYNYVRLRKSADASSFAAKIRNTVNEYGKEAVERTGFRPSLILRPVNDIYLRSGLPTGKGTVGNIRTVRLFFAIGIFILIIACLNFINLTTAKSAERGKEIGVKKVLGSNRGKLVMQFITETAFLCFLAAGLSILLMLLLLPYFNQFTEKSFTTSMLLSPGNLVVMAGIMLLVIPMAGLYPSFILSAFKPIKVLRGGFSQVSTGSLLRKGLVVLQFVISTAFISGTMIIWNQVRFMQNQDPGFDKENILIADVSKVPWNLRHEGAGSFKNDLLQQTGVTNVTACAAVPGRNGWNSQFAWPEGMPRDAQLIVEFIPVDEQYIQTLGLELAAGRDFRAGSHLDSTESLIINEAAMKLFGWGNDPEKAIGRKLATSGKEGNVIGVLSNYHQHGLQNKINPVVLGVANYISMMAIKYERLTPARAAGLVQAAWKEVYSGYSPEISFMDEDFNRQYKKEEKFKSMLGLAAGLSIVIACLGLLGLAIYTAQKRVKEIGIRKVLGASVSGIITLLSKEFLKLVVISIVIAVPVVLLFMNKWLNEFAYRIRIGWMEFLVPSLILLAIAALTVGIRGLKAALANPVRALRSE